MSEMLRSYARRIAETRPPDGALGIFWIGQAGFVLRAARPARVVAASPDAEIVLGEARVTPVPASHGVHVADAYSFGLVPGEHRYLGYVVELGGVRVYHAGDTIRYDRMAERLRALAVDVAL